MTKNNELCKNLSSLKEYLLSLDEVKEYMKLKSIIQNDQKYKDAFLTLNTAKKNKNKDLLIEINEKYKDDPLINNFIECKKEVYFILKEIKEVLECKDI